MPEELIRKLNSNYSLVVQVAIYLLAGAFYVGLASGLFETKSHAVETYTTKETFKQHQDDQKDAINEIRQSLRDINRKLDDQNRKR